MKEGAGSDLQQAYSPRRSLGRRFGAAAVAELYRHRPPYSDELFELLDSLIGAGPQRVLDAGAGPGKLARALVARGYAVDAVDLSVEMIRVGQCLPEGNHPSLRWIVSSIEDAALGSDYGMVVAGASFHWFDADRVLARLAEVIRPGGYLVVMDGDGAWRPPWEAEERQLFIRFVERMTGTRPVWGDRNLEQLRLLDHPRFRPVGHRVTEAAPFRQSLDDYIACQHSRATFTPEAMGPALMQEFDVAFRELLAPHAQAGWLNYSVRTRVEWGRPIGESQ